MTRTYDFIVVGTSFSALVAIERLVQAGIKPLVLDSSEPEATPGSREKSKLPSVQVLDELGQKSWFGSNEPYRGRQRIGLKFKDGILARPSFAFGGFSRVWGASFDFEDTKNNPNTETGRSSIESQDIQYVEELVPHALNNFEDSESQTSSFRSSASSSKLLRAITKSSRFLRNYELSPSRLAVTITGSQACTLQGTCLTGCPNSSIYFTGDRILELEEKGLIELATNHLVLSFREDQESLAVDIAVGPSESKTLITKRLLLATGPISTSTILIKSGVCGDINHADTSTAFTSALFFSRANASRSHTLPQFFIRERKNNFLAQVYAPSELHLAKLQSKLPFGVFFTPLLRRLINYIHPVIIYFNSDISDSLSIQSRGGSVEVTGKNTLRKRRIQLVTLLKFAIALLTRGVILTLPFTQFTPPGSGYHFGAGLSIQGDLDSQGRPFGLKRVSVLDASSLNHLPIGSITPTVMANSSRIVREILLAVA